MLNIFAGLRIDSYALASMLAALISMLFLTGLLLMMRKKIRELADVIMMSRRFPKVRNISRRLEPDSMMGKLANLLNTVMKKPMSPMAFLSLCIVIFFIVYTVSATNLTIPMSGAVGLSFAMIPWLFLRLKLERIRRRGSFEGEVLISSMLTQYWVSGGNIFETIERVIADPGDIRISAGLLSSFMISMRSTGSRARIREAADTFAYGIGTNWGRMLALDIRNAALTGQDIGFALEDILIQLREARALHEERKRINNESAKMSFFLVPVIYFGSVIVSIGMLGMPLGRFLRNQFLTKEGFALISFTVFLFILNIVLVETVSNRKLDF